MARQRSTRATGVVPAFAFFSSSGEFLQQLAEEHDDVARHLRERREEPKRARLGGYHCGERL
jgi:hypothetical protein